MSYNQLANIKVFGIGGGGSNAVNRMKREGVQGVEFYVANTDAQALKNSDVQNKIVLGSLGAGANPEVGEKAALDHKDDIKAAIKGADMIFVTAGMGGGTGTGAAPIFAKEAKDQNILTVGVVTTPFRFEGKRRMSQALIGIEKLRENTDAVIIVSNEKLMEARKNVPMDDAFGYADSVLMDSIRTITDLTAIPAMINLDFADVKSTLSNAGDALIGIGIGAGDNRAVEAAKAAIQCPLLEKEIKGATKCIVNVVGGPSMSISDAYDAVEEIKKESNNGSLDVIFGVSIKEDLGEKVMISVIASGFRAPDTFVDPYEQVQRRFVEDKNKRAEFKIPREVKNGIDRMVEERKSQFETVTSGLSEEDAKIFDEIPNFANTNTKLKKSELEAEEQNEAPTRRTEPKRKKGGFFAMLFGE